MSGRDGIRTRTGDQTVFTATAVGIIVIAAAAAFANA